MSFNPARYRHEHQNRMAAERLDVLEPVCSVKDCHKLSATAFESVFGRREFCRSHAPIWKEHYRIVQRILDL